MFFIVLVISDFWRGQHPAALQILAYNAQLILGLQFRHGNVILDYVQHLLHLDLYTQRSNIDEFIDYIFLSLKRATICQGRVAGSNR